MKTKTGSGKWFGITLLSMIAIMAACLSAGCRSGPETVKDDELDLAVREASDYCNANIPKGNKLAIISLRSDYPPLSEYIISTLTENLVNGRFFTVVERQQLDIIRAELDFNMSGEVDDSSAQAMGRMAGAETIIVGSVSALGDMWRFSVRALSVEKAEVQGFFNKNISSSTTMMLLTTGLKMDAGSAGSRGESGSSIVQLNQPVLVLANGTYTLMPRPRGRLNGIWQDTYISRVEVDSEYMTFYFENREAAGDGYGRSATVFWDKDYASLIDLDKPTIYKRNTGRTGQDGGYLVSCVFPRIDSRRLKLANRQGVVFIEIILGEPD